MEARAVSPSRPNINATDPSEMDSVQRQLEITVLGQMRDNLAGMTLQIGKLADGQAKTHEMVVGVIASKYDEQIERSEKEGSERLNVVRIELQRQIEEGRKSLSDHETRLRDQNNLVVRMGLGMAIIGMIAASALTAIVGILVTRMMGVH